MTWVEHRSKEGRRKRGSLVWQYFKVWSEGERAKCDLCDTIVSCKNGGTTGMIKHLTRLHDDDKGAASINYRMQEELMMKYIQPVSRRSLRSIVCIEPLV